MKKVISLFTIFSLMGLCAQANLLDDGNLSAATSGGQTSNSDWVLTVNFPDGVEDAAQFQTGFGNAQNTGVGGSEPPGTGTGLWLKSFEGNQDGSGDPLAQVALTQSILAPVSGDYQLSFVAGREANFIAAQFFVSLSSSGTGGSASVDLLAAVIPDGNLGGATSGNPGGTPFTLNLTGVTIGDTLTVTGQMVDGQDSQIPGGQSAFLDSFELIAVPEPSSLLLTLLGFVCVNLCRRAYVKTSV